jgi:hypothetical protein
MNKNDYIFIVGNYQQLFHYSLSHNSMSFKRNKDIITKKKCINLFIPIRLNEIFSQNNNYFSSSQKHLGYPNINKLLERIEYIVGLRTLFSK